MSAKDRRGNEVRQMRQAILKAACDIAAEAGWRQVTVRKVAEKVEYSPAALYEYFAGKEAILLALMREGFRLLAQEMRAVPEGGTPPSAWPPWRRATGILRSGIPSCIR